jgi:ABC-type branched-subunit amino acid transport system ATPase component
MLEVRGVTKRFNSIVVLEKVTLEIERAEVIGICGPNGSGKSTLLRIVSGLEKPDSGKILLDGRDITAEPAEKRVELGIGFSFQIPRPFKKMTVFENVLSACMLKYRDAITKAEELLKTFDLDEMADRKAETLSQGELKLLELCRTLCTSPDYILLDEPFTALDRENVRRIREKIREIKGEVGMIITAHQSRILEREADRVYRIEFGRIVEGLRGC